MFIRLLHEKGQVDLQFEGYKEYKHPGCPGGYSNLNKDLLKMDGLCR